MLVTPWLNVLRSRMVLAAGLLLQVRERWSVYDVYVSALLIFAASRLVVILGVKFGTLLVQIPGPGKWEAGPAWYYRLLRWDSGWYASIVSDGYRYSGDDSLHNSIVFFPLYPIVSTAVKSLFGIDPFIALVLVSNVAALIAALLMTKFVKDELGDEIALLSLAFFCFFPSSLFLSAGYAESLYLVFALLSLILLTRKKFVLAAVLAGLSLGTRPTGIVMIPVILWEMGRRETLPWPHLLPRMALCAVLAASGLLVYMAYLGIKFGYPLAFATGQASWDREMLLDRLPDWLNAGLFLVFLALTIWSFGRLQFAVSVYALGTLMLPYLTRGITPSMNRFVLMCFPAFVCLGILCRGHQWLASVLVGIFAALLLGATALFSQWYGVG